MFATQGSPSKLPETPRRIRPLGPRQRFATLSEQIIQIRSDNLGGVMVAITLVERASAIYLVVGLQKYPRLITINYDHYRCSDRQRVSADLRLRWFFTFAGKRVAWGTSLKALMFKQCVIRCGRFHSMFNLVRNHHKKPAPPACFN